MATDPSVYAGRVPQQTLEEFLAKYARWIGQDGKFAGDRAGGGNGIVEQAYVASNGIENQLNGKDARQYFLDNIGFQKGRNGATEFEDATQDTFNDSVDASYYHNQNATERGMWQKAALAAAAMLSGGAAYGAAGAGAAGAGAMSADAYAAMAAGMTPAEFAATAFTAAPGSAAAIEAGGLLGTMGGSTAVGAGMGDTAAMGMNQVSAMNPAALGAEGMSADAFAAQAAGMTPAEYAAASAITPAAGSASAFAAEAGGSGLLGNIGSTVTDAGKFLADNKWAGQLAGGLLGAAGSGDKTTSATSTKDPWGPAQPYLLDNLKQNKEMQDYYRANPFSDQQKTAYQGVFDANANGQANVANMLGMASNFGQSNRGLLGPMPQFTSGTKAAPIDWTKYQNIGLLGGKI